MKKAQVVNQTNSDETGQEKPLTDAQHHAIDLIITGKNDQDVADTLGKTRQTINGWRLYHPGIQGAAQSATRGSVGGRNR